MRRTGVTFRLSHLHPVVLSAVLGVLPLAGCGGDDDYGSNPPPSGNLELNSGTLGTGVVYQHTFANTGAFSYHCTLHPCMQHGTVTVAPAGLDSGVVTIMTPGGACPGGYTPLTISVKPGGYVRWVNQSVAHTVTSD